MYRKAGWILIALIALTTGPALAQMATKTLAPEHYWDMESVRDPQISPDGKEIVYTRTWMDPLNDKRMSALWIMDIDGARNRFLIEGSSPRWSPDGTRIAFVAQGQPKGSQIFVRWMDAEGAVTQITRLEKSPGSVRWSPDSRWLSFTSLVPAKDRWTVNVPGRPEGASWTKPPRVVDRLVYRRDRRGFLESGFSHVFIVPAEGGTARQLTTGDYGHRSPRWMPDGRSIVYSGLRVEDAEYQWRESEIYRSEIESGRVTQLTSRRGPDNSPVPSPDGSRIAYVGYDFSDDTYIAQQLYVMNADGSDPRSLTAELDRTPRGVFWHTDSRSLFFNVNSAGTRNLYRAEPGGSVQAVTAGTHILTTSSIDRTGRAVAVRSMPQAPEDVVSFTLKRPARLTQLTNVNEDVLAGIRTGEVEEIRYTSTDGLEIQGWIVKPPDFDPTQKYPLILSIHGGPHGMYGVGFSFRWQAQAADGNVVLYTNPRGSSGYGSKFGNEIKNAYPGKDFDDLMNGVDAVIARGYIDEDNMFVYGGSGGGVLTAWIVGHTDRFAAASSNYPVINWLSFVGTTDGASWYRNFKKMPWEDPSEHLRRSPLMYAGNVKTPTMLMTGIKDLRTPMSQTEEFYMALKVQKVPTAMIRFNEEWHGTSSKPSNFLRSLLYMKSWFEQHARKPVTAQKSG